MNTGWWNYVVLFGIPAMFILFFLMAGVKAFRNEIEQEQVPAYNPNTNRS